MTFEHISVLSDELTRELNINEGSTIVDCTGGGGGHAKLILDALGPSGRLIAFDRDEQARSHLKTKFAAEITAGRFVLIGSAYSQLTAELEKHKVASVDGICADIGISSPQIDLPERGFSFQASGPLDMRMDRNQELSAKKMVNEFEFSELKKIIYELGEEPKAHFIAQAICAARDKAPITDTLHLAQIVKDAVHYKTKSRKHPATKTFQALRIYVNDELGELERLLADGFELLNSGGRLAVITFHSLEDKIVKTSFKRLGQGKKLPSHVTRSPLTEDQLKSLQDIRAKIIKPFPINPSQKELDFNPRARSAKLRVIEKL